MTSPHHIKRRAAMAEDWMLTCSFPLWADKGVHRVAGFEERLDLAGQPTHDETSRVRVQARQVYCFSLAKLLGWEAERCDTLIARGLDVLTQQCQRPDGLYGKQVELGHGLTDARADLYDTAFVLLGFSAAMKAGISRAKPLGAALSKAIDECMERPAEDGGYYEVLPADDVRLQNPHMHLFEASIAHYGVSKDPASLQRTHALRQFIETRFYNAQHQCLYETAHGDGRPLNIARLEAGHHYEWAWLLHWHSRETGSALSPIARALYNTARTLTDASGRIALAHTSNHDIEIARYRTWSQTEALKSHIAAAENSWAGPAAIAQSFDLLWSDHILPAPKGAWIDCVDAQGARMVDNITAATGYHLFGAFQELMRYANTL